MPIRVAAPRWWRHFGLTAGAIAGGIAICLATAGCSPHVVAPPAAPSQPSGGGIGLNSAPLVSAFASPASKITPHSPLTGPPADPFTGTPADQWANGVAGIALPAARPIGSYTAAQVKFAYTRTRELLIAANLNTGSLLGGPPSAFAGLLTNQQRTQFLGGLDKTGMDKQGFPVSTRRMIMSFAPGSTQLIGGVIKVRGTMHARAGKDSAGYNVLDVYVDYIFVYPIEPPHQPDRWMRVVGQSVWTVIFGDWRGAATPFEPWVQTTGGFVAGIDCSTTDGYIHPDYPVNAPIAHPTVSPSGTPVDPYSMGVGGAPGCHKTTGT